MISSMICSRVRFLVLRKDYNLRYRKNNLFFEIAAQEGEQMKRNILLSVLLVACIALVGIAGYSLGNKTSVTTEKPMSDSEAGQTERIEKDWNPTETREGVVRKVEIPKENALTLMSLRDTSKHEGTTAPTMGFIDEENRTFSDVLGQSGWFEEEIIGGIFYIRTYYTTENGLKKEIAESFGYRVTGNEKHACDYVIDVDADGWDELCCFCIYGADGKRVLRIYSSDGSMTECGIE